MSNPETTTNPALDFGRVYRNITLGVASQPWVRQLMQERGRKLVQRFVAGDELENAIHAIETLEADSVHGILDLLGEMIQSTEEAQGFAKKILEIFPTIAAKPWSKYVSVKPSQLGLDQSLDLCLEHFSQVLTAAKSVGAFVRIDMEDSPRVEKTIALYRNLRETHDNVGLVIQSMLHRSEQDLAALLPLAPNLRIVKGAYAESPTVAFGDKHTIDMQYRRLVYTNLSAGNFTAVATHDDKIIDDIKLFVSASGIPHERFEFQMLYGIRRDLQVRLAQEGYNVRAYIPYGKDWYAYFSRRIAERPQNALFVLRGMVGG